MSGISYTYILPRRFLSFPRHGLSFLYLVLFSVSSLLAFFFYLISVFVHRLVYPGHKSIAWEFGVAYEQCRCPLISCNRTMGLDGLKGYILFPSNLVLPFRLTPNSALDAVVSPFTHSTSGPDSLQSNQYLPHRHLQPPADGSRPAVETRLPDSCVTDAD